MRLYHCLSLPGFWVASDACGELYFFPARVDGWVSRIPYRGHREALREVGPYNAIWTGWPGYRGGES